jgi:hypothetical protein
MKRIKWLVLAGLLLLPSTLVFSQRGYVLVCRGGGDLYFNYTPFSNFSPNPQVWITFKKGPQGVGQNVENRNSLQPGQAAWLDRRIEPNEPERIIVTDVRDFSISWTKGQVTGISSSLPYLSVLQDANKFQAFVVYNDGRGNFVATAVGPSY